MYLWNITKGTTDPGVESYDSIDMWKVLDLNILTKIHNFWHEVLLFYMMVQQTPLEQQL